MDNGLRIAAAWFVYETVIPILPDDGWYLVVHRPNVRTGFRETVIIQPDEDHRASEFGFGSWRVKGRWFVNTTRYSSGLTWAVIDEATGKTFIVTPWADRKLGRAATFSLPTHDMYNYPGEYVTSC